MSNQPPQEPPEGWEPRPQWGASEHPTEPQAERWETYGPPAPPGQDHSAWAQQARNERQQLPPQGPPMPPQAQGWGMQYPQQPPQAQKPRKKRRVFMWAILAINALFLYWIIAGAGSNADNCAGEVGQALEDCEAASAVGTGIGIIFIIFLWAMVDVILGVLYIVTRRRSE